MMGSGDCLAISGASPQFSPWRNQMSSPLRVGVVGMGMGVHHAKACLNRPEIELVAIAEPQQDRFDRLHKHASDMGPRRSRRPRPYNASTTIRPWCGKPALMRSPSLPTKLHHDASIWCLEAGLHVMCEKPPATSAQEMQHIAECADARDLVFAYVRQQRFTQMKFTVRDMVRSGGPGRVSHAESHWLRSRNIPWRQGWGSMPARVAACCWTLASIPSTMPGS